MSTNASERITREVTTWPGVEALTGERGEWSFRVVGREIGHLHGDHAAHLGVGRTLGTRLREEGRLAPHPVFPDSLAIGARRIEHDADVQDVIEILRLNYERVVARYGSPVEA